jgi:hypothetical protein
MLYIAARAPRPGFTKTRLGSVIGHDSAAYLYAAFLHDLAQRFHGAPYELGWFITPPDTWPEIAPYVLSSGGFQTVIAQPDGDWTARQRALFATMPEREEDRTILIASDSPQVPIANVRHAFALLESHDLVLGPVHDGGYYLIGMRGASVCRVLDGVTMSQGDVLAILTEQAHRLGYSVGFTEPTFDVDEFQDLAALRTEVAIRADLRATRDALSALGLLDTVPSQRELVFAGEQPR